MRNRSVGAAATIREQGEELLRLRRDLAEQRARCRELEARVAAAESSHDELERVRAQLGAQSERLAESLHIEARLRAALAHSEAAVRSARRETARREEAAAALERQFAKHLRGEIAAIDVELLCFDEMNGVIRTSKFTKLGNMLAPGVAAPALAGFAACALLLYGVLAVLHRTLAF